MNDSSTVEFKLSKSKLALLLLFAVIFLILGIAFFRDPKEFKSYFISSETIIFIVGLVSILFSTLGLIVIIKKLFDNKPGLTINSKGIYDNASGVSAGFIPWNDVIEIKRTVVSNQSFANIIVRNPEFYINKHKSPIVRKMAKINYNSFGTVIGIPSSALNCNFEQLLQTLNNKFVDFKKSSGSN